MDARIALALALTCFATSANAQRRAPKPADLAHRARVAEERPEQEDTLEAEDTSGDPETETIGLDELEAEDTSDDLYTDTIGGGDELEAEDTSDDLYTDTIGGGDDLEAEDTVGDPESEALPCLEPEPDDQYNYDSSNYGPSDMRVSFWAKFATTDGTTCHGGDGYYRSEASTGIDVKVFNRTRTVAGFYVEGGRATLSGDEDQVYAHLDVMGESIHVIDDLSADAGWSMEQTFFTGGTSVIGVTVSGDLTGTVGVDGRVGLDLSGDDFEFNVGLTPYVTLNLDVRGGVGIACASVGGGADVVLGHLELPVDLYLRSSEAEVEASLGWEVGSGEVYVYASYCAGEWKETITDWDGETGSLPLVGETFYF